ncbi:MAG TPA: hypothetical protein VK163_02955 [Opitutaceae bacterium]|nr:hypothetical protein [Opitutaceae bacterium]
MLESVDGADRGGILGELAAGGEQALVDDVVEQRRFAGTGDAGERDKAAERERDGEIAEVVLRGALENEPRNLGIG